MELLWRALEGHVTLEQGAPTGAAVTLHSLSAFCHRGGEFDLP